MAQRIVIDPVSRIEGHAKISIYLDEAGQVRDARFHVTEFRGFEQFCQGRPLWEMAGITSRVYRPITRAQLLSPQGARPAGHGERPGRAQCIRLARG